jgi:RNA polymerase sigma factor (sigma-70 family)
LDPVTNILTAVVKQAGQGEEHAQSLLYGQFSKAMFNICTRMTGSIPDAEDILQESFLLAFRNINKLKDPASFGGWLKRIVINECIRYSKKKIHWQELDEKHEEIAGENDDNWLMEMDIRRVQEEIKKLPDACRTVFNLYVLENYAHKDIAEALNISVSTSKSQYHRARQLLKERLLKLQENG